MGDFSETEKFNFLFNFLLKEREFDSFEDFKKALREGDLEKIADNVYMSHPKLSKRFGYKGKFSGVFFSPKVMNSRCEIGSFAGYVLL